MSEGDLTLPQAGGPRMPAIPRVRLVRELGRGGMGVVFEGVQEFLERRVAVKVIAADLASDEFNARFRREAQILAGLKHPNIVTCFDSGVTDDGLCYMVMEFVDGPGTLRQWTTEHGPLSCGLALDTCGSLADALDHAWSLGIIHRDVKPENVLFQQIDDTSAQRGRFRLVPKLIDLGIARASDRAQLTQAGMVVGTMATMAPEQIEFPAEVDYRADIYGLGCVLYHALTGQAAFQGPTGVMLERKRKFIPDPRASCDVPDEVAELVMRMLAYDREDRPQSYREVIECCIAAAGDRERSGRTSALADLTRASVAGAAARPAAPAKTPAPSSGRRSATAAPRSAVPRWVIVGAACVAVGVGAWALRGSGTDAADPGGTGSPAAGGAQSEPDRPAPEREVEVPRAPAVQVHGDRELPAFLTELDSSGLGFLHPASARDPSATDAPEQPPFAMFLPELQRDAGDTVWSGTASYLENRRDTEAIDLDPDAALPVGHELVCRILAWTQQQRCPELAGLVLALPDGRRVFAGVESRPGVETDDVECRGVLAPHLGMQELGVRRRHVRREGRGEWLLEPLADPTDGSPATTALQLTSERPLDQGGDIGAAFLLTVQVQHTDTGCTVVLGDGADACRVEFGLPPGQPRDQLRIGLRVLHGKPRFYHLESRPLPAEARRKPPR
ncbi:MAG: serine/threonine protein kinase [Planctomycetes bacterium]|nr:serine/threonine protein kinase [Planctomycetota bacterium]